MPTQVYTPSGELPSPSRKSLSTGLFVVEGTPYCHKLTHGTELGETAITSEDMVGSRNCRDTQIRTVCSEEMASYFLK
jgi:hypothetical protein